jgi:hypothetical protein
MHGADTKTLDAVVRLGMTAIGSPRAMAAARRKWIRCALFAMVCLSAGCDRSPRTEVVARNDLVSVVRERSRGTDVLSLIAQPGVKINALLLPAIDRGARAPIVFDAPGRTADSAYFLSAPTASIDGKRPVQGMLRASACPTGKQVCLSVALPVDLP